MTEREHPLKWCGDAAPHPVHEWHHHPANSAAPAVFRCGGVAERQDKIAAERLACATLADEMADRYERNAANPHDRGEEMRHTALALRALASAIRARKGMSP